MYLTLQEAAEYVTAKTDRPITPEALLRLGVQGRLLICAAFASCMVYNALKGETEEIGPSLLVLPPRHLMEIETEGSAQIKVAFGLDKTYYRPYKTRTKEQLRIWWQHLDDFIGTLNNPGTENKENLTNRPTDKVASSQGDQVIENAVQSTEELTIGTRSRLQRPGITKAQALTAFGDLVKVNFTKVLTEVPRWIEDARVSKGTRGGRHKTIWCPILLAVALHQREYATKKQLNRVFFDHEFLKLWREEWHDQSEDLA